MSSSCSQPSSSVPWWVYGFWRNHLCSCSCRGHRKTSKIKWQWCVRHGATEVYLLIFHSISSVQVTGGANGIGRAICVELAKCGCNVAVVDVDLEGAKECCESLFLLGVKAFPYEVRWGHIPAKNPKTIDKFIFHCVCSVMWQTMTKWERCVRKFASIWAAWILLWTMPVSWRTFRCSKDGPKTWCVC